VNGLFRPSTRFRGRFFVTYRLYRFEGNPKKDPKIHQNLILNTKNPHNQQHKPPTSTTHLQPNKKNQQFHNPQHHPQTPQNPPPHKTPPEQSPSPWTLLLIFWLAGAFRSFRLSRSVSFFFLPGSFLTCLSFLVGHLLLPQSVLFFC